MAGKTNAMTDNVLNWFLGTVFPTVPANVFIALLTTAPTLDDMTSAVETTYTNYARPSIVSSSVGWNAPAAGSGTTRQITNKLALNFGTAGSGPVTIVAFAICKTVSTAITTAGEALYWNTLTGGNQTINNGNPVTAAIAALIVNED
jgi:hypothetical protein